MIMIRPMPMTTRKLIIFIMKDSRLPVGISDIIIHHTVSALHTETSTIRSGVIRGGAARPGILPSRFIRLGGDIQKAGAIMAHIGATIMGFGLITARSAEAISGMKAASAGHSAGGIWSD
jgi:hypothetical protein